MLHLLLLAFASLHAGDMGESIYFDQNPGLLIETQEATEAGVNVFESILSDSRRVPREIFDTVIFNGEFVGGYPSDLERVRFQLVVPGPDGGEEIIFPLPNQRQAVRIENGRFWGTILFPGPAPRVPMIFRVTSLEAVKPLSVYLYDVEAFLRQDTEEGGSSIIRFRAPQEKAQAKREKGFKILDRSSWQPEGFNPKQGYEEQKPQRVTFHHSAGRHVGGRDAVKEIANIHRMHTDPPEKGGRGWNDIAYHYFVDKEGNIYAGRPETVIGAHAGSKELNKNNIGISLLGNFHPPKNDKTPDAQGSAISWLMDSLVAKYKMSFDNVDAHRDLKATECPGDFSYRAFSYAKPKDWKPKKNK